MGKHYFRKHRALRHLTKTMGKRKKESVLAVFEGPHGSGKTFLAHKFAKLHKKTTIIACRDVVHMAASKKENISAWGECIIIDNAEYLKGRDQTQEKLAELIKDWRSSGTNIILSGIDIRNRLPKLFEIIGEVDFSVDLS